MPRAAYNDTMAVYESAGFLNPGALRRTVICRPVFIDLIISSDQPFASIYGYATYNGPGPSTGNWSFTTDGISVDFNLNDVLEFASNPGVFYQALYVEEVIPRNGALYRRVWFIQ